MEKKPSRILVIVESPTKAKHIKEFLPSNYIVMASKGHITQINDSGVYNMGIDPEHEFKGDYVISPDKKDIVKKLKEQVKVAELIYLAEDDDREGECIAYHVKTQLKIPDSKYERITYHEVTKEAILKAIEHPRKLNYNLIAAGDSRAKADKIIGYRLSGIARANVGARSVGRCQSAGLKLIVEKEKEIQAFDSKTYYDLYLTFEKNKTPFKAKYTGTTDKDIKAFDSLDACKPVVDACKKGEYSILDIEHKDGLENTKPPFITTTFQQEVAKRLGMSVKYAMDCAQKLFEGGYITYHRTDDAELSPEFIPVLQKYITDHFGAEAYAGVKKAKKSENTQAGHEGLRVTDLDKTPDNIASYIDDERLAKVYSIIWQRTVASGMKPAVIANTIYTIKNGEHRFSMTSKELKSPGYRQVYAYGADDDKSEDDQLIKESFKKNEVLKKTSLEAIEKQTQPPARYSEASFVAELTKREIGRPSTYSTILSTLLDEKRGYCRVENKKIIPTPLGIKLSEFLDKAFPDIINIKYTAELEAELDQIAKGEKSNIDFLQAFYTKLEQAIAKVDVVPPDHNTPPPCPKCGGEMAIRKGKYGIFYGCKNYPKCDGIVNIKKGS